MKISPDFPSTSPLEICAASAMAAVRGRRSLWFLDLDFMRNATADDIAVLELLAAELERSRALERPRTLLHAGVLERSPALRAVELELANAVSVVAPSVVVCDRDCPVVLPERAVVRDQLLVVDDASRSCLGESWLLCVALWSGRKAGLEVGGGQEFTGR